MLVPTGYRPQATHSLLISSGVPMSARGLTSWLLMTRTTRCSTSTTRSLPLTLTCPGFHAVSMGRSISLKWLLMVVRPSIRATRLVPATEQVTVMHNVLETSNLLTARYVISSVLLHSPRPSFSIIFALYLTLPPSSLHPSLPTHHSISPS